MLLPPCNLFRDNCIRELNLQRLYDHVADLVVSPSSSNTITNNNTVSLMDVVREAELVEQGLDPFDPVMLRPVASLPPGKLPGVVSTAVSVTPLFTDTTADTAQTGKQPAASQLGGSPKRRRVENVTIQHF